MRPALVPALLLLTWPVSAASAQTCSLTLLNSVPLTVSDNVASVPASVGTKEKQFEIDTAAPDNQMAKDAMRDFGLTAIDFTPTQKDNGAGSFSTGQLQTTRVDGLGIGLGMYGSAGG